MFKPLNKNILLTFKKISSNASGIYLGSANTNVFEVVSVGKEVLEVKVNDLVYVNESAIKSLVIDNKEYFVIEEKDIYMILED